MDWIRWLRAHARIVVPVLVGVTAVTTLFVTIATPDRIFFDETYYVNDARDFLEFGVESGYVVHPPLAKMLIAFGITVFGDTPFGWRAVGALLAVASVGLVYDLSRRLGMRFAAAGVAGLALALDGVWIAQAHTAMLDIHLAFFIVLGTWALVRDRDVARIVDDRALAAAIPVDLAPRQQDPPPLAVYVGTDPVDRVHTHIINATLTQAAVTTTDHVDGLGVAQASSDAGPRHLHEDLGPPEPWWEDQDVDGVPLAPDGTRVQLTSVPRPHRRWLLLAGAAFGAAVATKWSGALALVAAGIVFVGWELVRRRRLTGSPWRQPWPVVALVLGPLFLVPVVVYTLSWTPWFVAFDNTYMATGPCMNEDNDLDCDGLGRVVALVDFHQRIVGFHLDLEADHAYRAPATGWPIQHRPVVYYYETCGANRQDRVAETDSDGEVTIPEPCAVEPGQAGEIMSLGNPAVWWGFLLVLPLFGAALRRRSRGSWIVVAFIALQFTPWLVVARPVFNFYTVPLVPFVALGLAIGVDEVNSWRSAWRAWAVGAGTAVALAGTLAAVATFTPAQIPWTLSWYLVGIGALVAGFLLGTDTSRVTPPEVPASVGVAEIGDSSRVWPIVTACAVILVVGVYFLPLWWGVAMPSWFVRAHWWLPTWI